MCFSKPPLNLGQFRPLPQRPLVRHAPIIDPSRQQIIPTTSTKMLVVPGYHSTKELVTLAGEKIYTWSIPQTKMVKTNPNWRVPIKLEPLSMAEISRRIKDLSDSNDE